MHGVCVLLRSSEYLRKHISPDPEKCLRVEHIIVAVDGEDSPAPVGVKGDEVVMFQPGSKNDWLGQGTSNNIYSDPDGSPLCVVSEFIQSPEGSQTSLSAIGWDSFVHSNERGGS